MLYNLFEYLNNNYDLVGSGVFQYLSFRAGMAAIFSLIISILFGKKIINSNSNPLFFLNRRQPKLMINNLQ